MTRDLREGRTVTQSDTFRQIWASLKADVALDAALVADAEAQLGRIRPALRYNKGEFRMHYAVPRLRVMEFVESTSLTVPFDSNLGTLELNLPPTVRLQAAGGSEEYTLPASRMQSCEDDGKYKYCSVDMLQMATNSPCVDSAMDGDFDGVKATCSIRPTSRVNRVVRLSDRVFYYDLDDKHPDSSFTSCPGARQRRKMQGQGVVRIGRGCQFGTGAWRYASGHAETGDEDSWAVTPASFSGKFEWGKTRKQEMQEILATVWVMEGVVAVNVIVGLIVTVLGWWGRKTAREMPARLRRFMTSLLSGDGRNDLLNAEEGRADRSDRERAREPTRTFERSATSRVSCRQKRRPAPARPAPSPPPSGRSRRSGERECGASSAHARYSRCKEGGSVTVMTTIGDVGAKSETKDYCYSRGAGGVNQGQMTGLM